MGLADLPLGLGLCVSPRLDRSSGVAARAQRCSRSTRAECQISPQGEPPGRGGVPLLSTGDSRLPPTCPHPGPRDARPSLAYSCPAVPAPPSLMSAHQLTGGFWAGVEAAQTARRRTRRTRRTRTTAMAVRLVGGPGLPLILAPAPSLRVGEHTGRGVAGYTWGVCLLCSPHPSPTSAQAPAGQPPLTQCLQMP